MAERPDIIIVMTDEERAVPPYEAPEVLAWRRRHAAPGASGSTSTASASTGTTPARWPACPAARRSSPATTPTCTASRRPTASARFTTIPACDGCVRARCPRWATGSARPDTTRTTTANGTSRTPTSPIPPTGQPLATNDDDGVVDPTAVQRYLDADPLAPYGFSGWVGPGAARRAAGQRRDAARPADRRPGRRVAEGPLRPAPRRRRRRAAPVPAGGQLRQPARHRAVPGVARRSPVRPSPLDPPPIPPAPTADEDLSTKPAAQIAFREAYYSGYGPAPAIDRTYTRKAQRTATCTTGCTPRWTARSTGCGARSPRAARRTRYWCARPITAICSARTAGCIRSGSTCTTRRRGCRSSSPASVTSATGQRTVSAPTSHVDLVPTLLGAAGVDVEAVAATLAETFSEVHALPGPRPDAGGRRRPGRRVASGVPDDARQRARGRHRRVGSGAATEADGESACAPADPDTSARRRRTSRVWCCASTRPAARGICGSWCARSTIRRPGPSPACAIWRRTGIGGEAYRTSPLDDQWELYDLTDDPVEALNRWADPELHDLRQHLRIQLKQARAASVPERNNPWPYSPRRTPTGRPSLLRRVLRRD